MRRDTVLAYRLAAHDLAEPATGWPGVLDVGVQDTPPGTVATLAVRARSTMPDPDPYADDALALVHGVRGAMHLHRAEDVPLLATALRPDDANDMVVSAHGRFFVERAAEGTSVGAAFDAVADAMREVMTDGGPRTKGELSTAVTPLVPPPLAPWCGGCGAHHVHDGLFRMASLAAGLRLRPAGDGSAVFLPPRAERTSPTPPAQQCRRDLVRRYLRRGGAVTPESLASWLGLTVPAARRWWAPLAADLIRIDVDGVRVWAHRDDVAAMRESGRPAGVHLLPPYDPLTGVAQRSLLVPDPARRRQVWRAAANPGVLLVDGEIAGVWRQRRSGATTTITVTAFAPLPARVRDSVAAAADRLWTPVRITFDE